MIAREVIEALRAHGYTLASAESCTGGNIAHVITEIAGCSDVFLGGVVSYSNEVKTNVLGVPADMLAQHGAVSEPVVKAMAEGARRVIGADYAVATSGIAGPGGATLEKPVGTVWTAIASPNGSISKLFHIDGNRSDVIATATDSILNLLLSTLKD